MKKINFTLVLLALLLSPSLVFAHTSDSDGEENKETSPIVEPCEFGSVIKCGDHGGDGHSQTLKQVVNDLFVGFDVDSIDKLDCDIIIDHDFGHVGEALMSYMHPDEEEHHRIDDLMGGEGSDSLDEMHQFMGKRYLGCDDEAFSPMMMNFSGENMMTGGGGFGPHSFSQYGVNGYGIAIQITIWLLALLGIVYIIQLITKQSK